MTLAPDTRDLLHHAISQLTPAGGTHISGGLESGAREVVRHLDARDLGRVILVSDGRPTVGESKPWALETLAARLLPIHEPSADPALSIESGHRGALS